MEIFGRTIEHNRGHLLPISNLVETMALAVAVSYPVGSSPLCRMPTN